MDDFPEKCTNFRVFGSIKGVVKCAVKMVAAKAKTVEYRCKHFNKKQIKSRSSHLKSVICFV